MDDIFYQALRYRIEERYKSQIISCLPIFHKILCMLEHLVFPREKAWRMLCICCNRVHFQDGMMLWIAPTFRRLDRRKSQRSCVLWPAIRCRLSALLAVDPQENRGGCCRHWTLQESYPSQDSIKSLDLLSQFLPAFSNLVSVNISIIMGSKFFRVVIINVYS